MVDLDCPKLPSKMTENDRAFNRMVANYELIRKYCAATVSETNTQFAADCERMFQTAELIHRIASDFYFDSVPDNGFVTFVRLSAIYTDKIVKQIQSNQLHQHYVKLMKLVLIYGDFLAHLYGELKDEEKAEHSSKGQLFVREKSGILYKEIYRAVNACNDVLPLKFSTAFCYWLPSDVRRGLRSVYLTIAAGKNLPWSLSSLFSQTYYDKYILSAYMNVNLEYPFNIWHLSENPIIVNLVNYFVNFGIPVKSKTLQIPKQTRVRLDHKGNILLFDRMTKQETDAYFADKEEQERQNSPGVRHRNHETIRCRYSYITSEEKIRESLERIRNQTKPALKVLKHHTARKPGSVEMNNNCGSSEKTIDSDDLNDLKNLNPEGKLVLYLHGGAFFTMGAKSYEMVLRKIVNRLGGIPILAVDYSLTVPYPVPWQEILDVYLWILSGQEDVIEMLGFKPKQIICAGDSCGGYFALTLTIVLNELNKMLTTDGLTNGQTPSPPVPLPISLVSVFGVFSFSNLSPSKIMLGLEPIVETSLLLIVVSLLGANIWSREDFKRIENTERYQRIVAENKDNILDDNESTDASPNDEPGKPDDPWFRCDLPTYMNRAAYVSSFFDHPFINPLLYTDKFDELKSVDLYCCVGNDDPTLDCNIEMARSWKGKVCLDTFEDVTHAYLQLTSVSREASDAFEITTRRLQEAVGLR